MKIKLPVTYRSSVFQLVVVNLYFLVCATDFFYKEKWIFFVIFMVAWFLLMAGWFMVRLTLTEKSIIVQGLMGAKELNWDRIKEIEIRQRNYAWQPYKKVDLGQSPKGYIFLTAFGDQTEDVIYIPTKYKGIEKMREILALIELKAPEARIHPMVSKYFDRKFL